MVARATAGSGHATAVTLEDLARINTPTPTRTWRPIPHIGVVSTIVDSIATRGWKLVGKDEEDAFDITVTKNGLKMFGRVGVQVKGIKDKEMGMFVGFRQSHNKTLGLRIGFGTTVFVCSNGMFNGDVVIGKEHTANISASDIIGRALDTFGTRFGETVAEQRMLKEKHLNIHEASSFLISSVKAGALPLARLLPARDHLIDACTGGIEDIDDPTTVWGVQQAVTHEWKTLSPFGMMDRSTALNRVVSNAMVA